ncbi:MAG TPA: hypothetical protein VJK09_02095 [Candidatus Paceibacterota bacterium]
MSNKTVIGIIIGLIIIGGLVWWSLSSKTDNDTGTPVSTGQETQPQSITVNHYFQENAGVGAHTIEGTLTLPTPCHSLASDVMVAESMPEQVLIKFTTKAGEGICTQVLADKFFRVSFTASKDALITATLNGKVITLVYSETKEGITK